MFYVMIIEFFENVPKKSNIIQQFGYAMIRMQSGNFEFGTTIALLDNFLETNYTAMSMRALLAAIAINLKTSWKNSDWKNFLCFQ